MRLGLWAVALFVAALGAARADTPGAAPPAQSPEEILQKQRAELAAQPLDKSIWRAESDGSFTHLMSGLQCPAKIGDYAVAKPVTFDHVGLDVSCDYTNAVGTEVTLYLTRRNGQPIGDDLAKANAELRQFHPDLTLLPDSGEGALSDDPLWKRTLYAGNKNTLHSGIWMRDLSGWTMEFRASYVPGISGDAVALMETLSKQALATAGAHLAACDAAPPVTRGGTIVNDDAMMMEFVLIAGAGDDITGAKPEPENWCVERPATDLGPTLFWRNIGGDGHVGDVDRLTIAGRDPPQTLLIESEPLLGLVADADKKSDAPPSYVATLVQGPHQLIVAVFRGRPSAEDAFNLARDVLTGKRKPLAERDAGTKKITIFMDGK
ncbi:MAG TPA: hypothetical protein VHZ78_12385 [Rhizomicrobium sp.]|jgi:hypothetical protein|nr:hypothetical protein [Rhizomicrobium sp.]